MASVQLYNKDENKYRVLLCCGTKEDGKPNRMSKIIVAKSETEAKKIASDMEYEFRHKKDFITLKSFSDTWMEEQKGELSKSTLQTYKGILKNYIIPYLGNYAVKDISKKDVKNYLRELKKKENLSEKTIRNNFMLLSSLLTYAIDDDIIDVNVCKQIKKKPKAVCKKVNYYEKKDVDKMFECLELEINENHLNWNMYSMYDKETLEKINTYTGKMYRIFVYLALASACRRSELFGLDWDDVNFEKKFITINKVSLRTTEDGVYIKDSLKNGDASKAVTLPDNMMEMLAEYKTEQEEIRKLAGNRWVKSDRVFIATAGGKMSAPGAGMIPDTISSWFSKFIKKYNLPELTLHGLRHTSISYLINAGMNIKAVAEHAGHRHTSITTGTYTHVSEENDRGCADMSGTLLDK